MAGKSGRLKYKGTTSLSPQAFRLVPWDLFWPMVCLRVRHPHPLGFPIRCRSAALLLILRSLNERSSSRVVDIHLCKAILCSGSLVPHHTLLAPREPHQRVICIRTIATRYDYIASVARDEVGTRSARKPLPSLPRRSKHAPLGSLPDSPLF